MECVAVTDNDGSGAVGGGRVLTVAKVTKGAAGGYAEYLEGKAQAAELGDYYLKDGERVEAPGRWAAGAATVGAQAGQPVAGGQLRALMAVRRPDTGEPLRRHGASGEAVSALDATFSAPKSVSAVWATGGHELRAGIEQAHEQAIDRALDYAVQRVAMIRQRVDQRTVIHAKPAGLIATSWRHTTARAVEGLPPDPQLHSHVLLHGAVRKDGRVMAIDSRSWLVHRREVGAAYRTELARELHRLGFEIQRGTGRGQRYFEIAGVPQALIEHWSSRRHQVQAAILGRLEDQRATLRAIVGSGGPDSEMARERLAFLTESGKLDPTEERLMSATTRSPKVPVTHHDLDEHWRATASRQALDHRAVSRLQSPRPAMSPAEHRELLEGLTEFDATFPARDARAVALERSAGIPIEEALGPLRELRSAKEILVLADRTGTTREHRGRERTTVAIAERLVETTVPPLSPTLVDRETMRLDRQLGTLGGQVSAEQREAIKLACAARALVVIEGQAGSGKSTALIGIARVHQAAGRQIVVTSTAALAAERMAGELNDAGVQTCAYSTAALQAAIASGRFELTAETTVIHDEAALASTREQQRLLGGVREAGARLIEIGDPRQNQPVGAGGLWPHLERAARDAGAHIELTRNQRAEDAGDRRDQALFRHGQHEQAIRGYASRDRVHIIHRERHAEDQALDAAQADRKRGLLPIVIAQTSNEHLDQLNARAQAVRQQYGELGPESLPLGGRPYELHRGDEVQIRRTLHHPEHGPLRNGTTAQITDVDERGKTVSLRLADGQTIALDAAQAAQADVRLAYVQHPFPAQGRTTHTAHMIIAEHTSQEGSYVALTRAREQTHIYAAIQPAEGGDGDRLASLAARMSRTEPDLPSIREPLAQEAAVTQELNQADRRADEGFGHRTVGRRGATPVVKQVNPVGRVTAADEIESREPSNAVQDVPPEEEIDRSAGRLLRRDFGAERRDVHERPPDREWPYSRRDGSSHDRLEALEDRALRHSWEP